VRWERIEQIDQVEGEKETLDILRVSFCRSLEQRISFREGGGPEGSLARDRRLHPGRKTMIGERDRKRQGGKGKKFFEKQSIIQL